MESDIGRTTIFYFTGTGNSLWLARTLGQKIGNTELISIVNWDSQKQVVNSDVIGLIFPVYIWGVPQRVINFLDKLKTVSPKYIFAIANNGGQVSNALVQLKKVMESKGLTLSSGWSIIMPSNYIPWGGPGSPDKQNQRFQAAELKLTSIAEKVQGRVKLPVEKGPLWQRIVFTGLYKLTLPKESLQYGKKTPDYPRYHHPKIELRDLMHPR